MSDSVQPHRWQPTRLPHPWDSPGKNTGVGCHFLLQCMKEKSESEVAQSCRTLSDPVDCSLPGSSVLGIFQARVLEWGTIAFSWYIPSKNKNLLLQREWSHLKQTICFSPEYLVLILQDLHQLLQKLKSLSLKHSEAKQYQNVGV